MVGRGLVAVAAAGEAVRLGWALVALAATVAVDGMRVGDGVAGTSVGVADGATVAVADGAGVGVAVDLAVAVAPDGVAVSGSGGSSSVWPTTMLVVRRQLAAITRSRLVPRLLARLNSVSPRCTR
jgi:hypothetical protein